MEIASIVSLFGSDPDRYRLLFQQSADPQFTADARGVFMELNPAAKRLLGITEPRGESLFEMIGEAGQRDRLMRQIQQEGVVREARLSLDTHGGATIDVAMTATAARDGEGRLFGFFGTIRDVTLETQTCALLADMARFPANDPNPVMRVSEAGVLGYANTASSPILETWAVEIGQPLPWSPLEQVRRCIAEGHAGQFEIEAGGRAWLIVCAPMAGQKYANLYGLDITGRREAEVRINVQADELARANERLQEANARLHDEARRLELIVRGIGDGVIVTDLEHRVTMMNQVARQLLEIPLQSGTGSMLPALLGRCTPPPAKLKEALEACRPDHAEQILLVLHEPCPRTLRIVASAWLDPAGQAAGRVLVLRDVTREREIDQLKSDFVGSVSHELRTPLTSIKGFTKALRQDGQLTDALRHQFLDIIDQETLRLEALIEDLLEISRLESGRLQLERRPVDIGRLIEAVCATLAHAFEVSALNLKIEVAEPLPQPLGDLDALRRVLINILSNAVKFTPGGGLVTVAAAPCDDGLAITVGDTGIGIPQTDLPHIFERFYRVHRPGVEVAGTGLGLAIVQEIVRRHGGTVTIGSELGHGTKVTVRLPGP
ncbi:MAG: ATP-binding protein [Candidatus Sumerlaeia bacterium]